MLHRKQREKYLGKMCVSASACSKKERGDHNICK